MPSKYVSMKQVSMKQVLLIVLVLLAGSASARAQASAAVPARPDNGRAEREKRELIRLTNEISRASVENDAATLERLMDDRFVLFFGDGDKPYGKAELIKRWTTKGPDSTAGGSSTPADFQVFLYGRTAVVVSRITDVERAKDGVRTFRTLAFDVWKKTKKGWRWVASRENLLPQ